MGVKINLRIKIMRSRNRVALKSISKAYGHETAMPTALELIIIISLRRAERIFTGIQWDGSDWVSMHQNPTPNRNPNQKSHQNQIPIDNINWCTGNPTGLLFMTYV